MSPWVPGTVRAKAILPLSPGTTTPALSVPLRPTRTAPIRTSPTPRTSAEALALACRRATVVVRAIVLPPQVLHCWFEVLVTLPSWRNGSVHLCRRRPTIGGPSQGLPYRAGPSDVISAIEQFALPGDARSTWVGEQSRGKNK